MGFELGFIDCEFWEFSVSLFCYIINCYYIPRTSGMNWEREGSSFLGFNACFEVGDGCDCMLCDIFFFLLHYNAFIDANIALLMRLIINEDR